jgi:arylsulfatase A-like enzyme/tetratricopeptide (TPR) repeat protein
MGKRKHGQRPRKPKAEVRTAAAAPAVEAKAPARALLPGGARLRLRPLVLAAAFVLLAAAVFFIIRGFRGGARIVREEGLNVLLITLDTTRADRLGCYGYAEARTPHLDDLARGGVLFADAYCPVPMTLPSHASIFTGLYPFHHGVHNNGTYVLGPDPATLAEALKGRGYETAAFTASFSVDSRFGLDRGFDVYDDTFDEDSPVKAANSQRRAEEVTAAFASWFERRSGDRFFAWVHFFDPHLPYDPPPPYREEFADRPYDGEIAYMDHYVGQVIDLLRAKGLLDRTLIVAAGDHGEALGENGEYGHGVFIYEPTVRVPLIFWAGGRLPAGRVVESRARLVDIMPTVLDLLGAPAVERIDGTSLVSRIRRPGGKPLDAYLETFYPRESRGWSELTGLVSGSWKYIQAPRPELYDLGGDSGETRDLAAAEPRKAAEMKGRLEAAIRSAMVTTDGKRTLTAEEQERLRALGYVQFAGAADGGTDYPDPKDKMDELALIQKAQQLEYAEDFAGAERVYAELLSLSPHVADNYINLAHAQARQKKIDAVIETLNKGAAAVPGSNIILARLGHTYLFAGRPAKALETMRQILEDNPDHFDALTVCATILEASGRHEEARACMERGLAVEPENKFLRTSLARNLGSSGRYPEAIEIYSALVRDYPSEASFFQGLGISYGMSGDYPRAIENLNRALALEPTPTALINLAVAYRDTGQIEDAIQVLERFVAFPGNDDQDGIRSARGEIERLKARLK